MKRWMILLFLLVPAVSFDAAIGQAPRPVGNPAQVEKLLNQLNALDEQQADLENTRDALRDASQILPVLKRYADGTERRHNVLVATGQMTASEAAATARRNKDEFDAFARAINQEMAATERALDAIKDRRASLSQNLSIERLRRQGKSGANAIQVLAGTYGGNCRADPGQSTSRGNATPKLAEACDGRTMCGYVVDWHVIGDPAVGCPKTYVAEWTCGDSGRLQRVTVSPEAGYKKIATLTCGPRQQAYSRSETFDNPASATRHFDAPRGPSGRRLDGCLKYPGQNCGQPAADAFCKQQGLAHAAQFKTLDGFGKEETETLNGEVCKPSFGCGYFLSIDCAGTTTAAPGKD